MGVRRPLSRLAHAVDRNEAVSGIVRRVLPEGTRRRMAAAIGADKPQDIDLTMVELIRERDRDWLADPEHLERELLPALGLSNDPRVYPEHLRSALGRGLRHWQAPNQFSRYLAHLARYPITRYLELGVWHGGTFVITVEYLSRFNTLTAATAMDIDDVPAMRAFQEYRPIVDFVQLDTRSPEFRREIEKRAPFDLVLVDADHSYEAIRSDVEVVRPHTNILALHDIVDISCLGVQQTWRELKTDGADGWDFFEFTEQYEHRSRGHEHEDVLGLGIAVRKEFAAVRAEPQAGSQA